MTGILLLFQAATWLTVLVGFLQGRSASAYHPLGFYLAFHGLVFVIRPIVEYVFGFEHVFYVMRFYPSDDVVQLTLVLTSFALLVFAAASALTRRCPTSTAPFPTGSSPPSGTPL
jgi:hypothetical protein